MTDVAALTAERDALRLQVERLKDALKIARHWMHIEADLGEFESFEFNRAQVDATLFDPDAGAALLAAADLLKRRWDQLTDCVNEFEPDDMGACSERRDALDEAILGVIKARYEGN